MMFRQKKNNEGFSLVELAFIVFIFGLATATLSQQYRQYVNVKNTDDTKVRGDQISQAFSRYYFNFQSLPCPAAPKLAPSDPNAGKSDCTLGSAPYAQWSAAPKCDATTGICVTAGGRHTSLSPGVQKDPVLIGTLPYIDLGISLNDSVDAWGNRMTYAVSYFLTDKNKFNPALGVIGQENYDRNSNWITNTQNRALDPPVVNAYMLAVAAHGRDGKGAWNYQGLKTVPCDMTVIDKGTAGASPTSTGRDNENCNGDYMFLGNSVGQNDAVHALTSFAKGRYYYDDTFLITDIVIDNDKWTAEGPGAIRNKSTGFVGIGTSNPVAPLNVDGNIKADNLQADRLCDENTGNCFDQSLISPGLNCNDGLMTGVADSRPLCQTMVDTTGLVPRTCPAGQYINGIDATGKPTCAAP